MFSLGDQLLFVLSAKRELPWRVFSALIARSISELPTLLSSQVPRDNRFIRYRSVRVMESLGYCDVDYTDGPRIFAAPPTLIRLPLLGLPKFQLVGSRSPSLINRLHGIQKQFGVDLQLHIESQQGELILPSRMVLEVSELAVIELVSNELCIPLEVHPAAFLAITFAPSLGNYWQSLAWHDGEPTSITARYFNVRELCFSKSDEDAPNLRLAQWLDYYRQRRRHYLIAANKHAVADPDWSRYVILKDAKKNVLLFDGERGLFAVPNRVPLPKPIERAVALCSGESPLLMRRETIDSFAGVSSDLLVYKSISAGFAQSVAARLEQNLSTVSLNV